jgi:DNA (cytosine-5)-methyltransferase 1
MFHQFVRVAKLTQPPFIIGENVTGLLSMKSGPRDEDPLVIELIRKAFDEIGYTISYQVLEASNFGVPQSRKRLLIVGWKTDKFPNFTPASFWASVTAWGDSQTLGRMESFVRPTLEGALKLHDRCIPPNFDTVAIPVSADTVVSGTPHPYVSLKANATDETYGDKTYDRCLSCGKRDSPIHSEVLNLKQPCKTIICTYDHQPRLLVGLKHPDGSCYVRTLLPDELKQIQGFPADFKLCGSVKDQVVQIGNAVPPALVQSVATNLKSFLTPSVAATAAAPPKKKLKVVRAPKV